MKFQICTSFLIYLVGYAAGEMEDKTQGNEITLSPNIGVLDIQAKGDDGNMAEMRPGTLRKRSMSSTLMNALFGGGTPPNQAFENTQAEPKILTVAYEDTADIPAANSRGGFGPSYGWGWDGSTAEHELANIFATKAEILPYAGQVAKGLTGMVLVKGKILKKVHNYSKKTLKEVVATALAAAAGAAESVAYEHGHTHAYKVGHTHQAPKYVSSHYIDHAPKYISSHNVDHAHQGPTYVTTHSVGPSHDYSHPPPKYINSHSVDHTHDYRQDHTHSAPKEIFSGEFGVHYDSQPYGDHSTIQHVYALPSVGKEEMRPLYHDFGDVPLTNKRKDNEYEHEDLVAKQPERVKGHLNVEEESPARHLANIVKSYLFYSPKPN